MLLGHTTALPSGRAAALHARCLQLRHISSVGIGVPLDVPEWGTMVESYERFLLTLPWTVLSAGAAIFVTVLAFSLFGDGLRDILDPRSRRALVQAAIPSTLPAKAFVAAEA